jgi:hypothetical protein
LAFFGARPELARIWEFDRSGHASPGPTFPKRIYQIPEATIWIIDPFAAGKLILHSRQMLEAGIATLQVRRGVFFDSNMYDLILRFVEERHKLVDSEAQGAKRLIESLVALQYDFQFLPYNVEQFQKNDRAKAIEYASRITHAVLRLHTMDQQQFRATGRIVLDHDRLAPYERHFGTTDFDEIVASQIEPATLLASEPPAAVRLHLACLMRMVQIRKVELSRGSPQRQAAQFDDFVHHRIGAQLATMRIVALFYFGGYLDTFIRLQRGQRIAKMLGDLQNCAWDLYLASLPIKILAECDEPKAELYSFCTREAGLANVLGISAVRHVIVGTSAYSPAVEIDDGALREAFPDAGTALLDEVAQRASEHLRHRVAGEVVPLSPSQVDELCVDVQSTFLKAMG